MKINQTVFFIFILSLCFISNNFAQDSDKKLIHIDKNFKIDINSDESEEEIYISSSNSPFIKSQNKLSNNSHKQQLKKTLKKIFYLLLISGVISINIFLYFKLINYYFNGNKYP